MNEMETVNYSQDTIDNSYVRSLVKSYFTLISWFLQKTVKKCDCKTSLKIRTSTITTIHFQEYRPLFAIRELCMKKTRQSLKGIHHDMELFHSGCKFYQSPMKIKQKKKMENFQDEVNL